MTRAITLPVDDALGRRRERVEPSPLQAPWFAELRATYARDPRRVRGCEGCVLFGLCLHHMGESTP